MTVTLRNSVLWAVEARWWINRSSHTSRALNFGCGDFGLLEKRLPLHQRTVAVQNDGQLCNMFLVGCLQNERPLKG